MSLREGAEFSDSSGYCRAGRADSASETRARGRGSPSEEGGSRGGSRARSAAAACRRSAPDEGAVVLLGHLAGAVIELELLQRRERAVTLLCELEPAAVALVRLIKHIPAG